MAQNDKTVEANSSHPENSHTDSPPVYTPRSTATPVTPIHPPPPTAPAVVDGVPERVHAPTAPFSIDFTKIGPEPTNVVCPRCHYGVCTSTRNRAGTHAGIWSAICCLTCGIIAAILPLVIPSCQDVEHTCPHCGFLMARYRRGVDNAKVYPVNHGYIPIGQDDHPLDPLPEFSEHTGVTEPPNK